MTPEPRGLTALTRIGRLLESQKAAPRYVRARSSTARRVAARMPVEAAGAASQLANESTRLLMFGGKGGVGKTTCAAAAAVGIASLRRRPRVLLMSTDPAHSLGDVFGLPVDDEARSIAGGPSNLLVREIDARKQFTGLRSRFAEAIDALVDRLAGGSSGAGAASLQERQVLQDLFDLAPPGVDELIAIIEVTDALLVTEGEPDVDLVIVDSAPTGHALRLLEMPALAHDWVKALMAILLKYQAVVGVGELGEVLLRLSHGLRRLRELLTDSERTTFVVVTRAAALPHAETRRLLRRLRAASISVPVVLVNAVGAGSCTHCQREARAQSRELKALARELDIRNPPAVVVAPGWMPAPAGASDLRRFATGWRQMSSA
jgi:arsenite-transporting ATPase